MADSKITVKIDADVANAVSGIKNVSQRLQEMKVSVDTAGSKWKSFLAVGSQATVVLQGALQVIRAVSGAIKEVTDCYSIQEQAESKLQAALTATKNAVGMSSQELLDLASSLQKVTTYGDESILAVEQLFVSTSKIGKDVMPRATKATLDMAAALGEDLNSAAKRLSKTLADPKSNLDALKDANIQLTDAQKNQIKQLQEQNKLYEAQSIVLAAVESSYGGVAESIANTDSGKLTQIENVWGDIKESLGGALLDTISPALDTLYEKLTDISDWANQVRTNAERNKNAEIILNGGYVEGFNYNEATNEDLQSILNNSAYFKWLKEAETSGFSDEKIAELEQKALKTGSPVFSREDYLAAKPAYEELQKRSAAEGAKKAEEQRIQNRIDSDPFYEQNLLRQSQTNPTGSEIIAQSIKEEKEKEAAATAEATKALEEAKKAKDEDNAKVKEARDKFISSNSSLSLSAQIDSIDQKINQAQNMRWQGSDDERKKIEEIIAGLEAQKRKLLEVETTTEETTETALSSFDKTASAIDKVIGAYETYGSYIENFLQSGLNLYTTILDSQISYTEKALSECQDKWSDYFDELDRKQDGQRDTLNYMLGAGKISYEDYIAALDDMDKERAKAKEEATTEEKDLQKQADKLKEKQFNAEKLNSIASILVSTAIAAMKAYELGPIVGPIMAGIVSATGAMQVATVSAQQYTPLAAGGIVTKPTYALLGEGGSKEAVLPLTDSNMDRMGLSGSNGTIYITVNVGTAYNSEQLSEDVFYAIQRAQRVGSLPTWEINK